MAFTLAVLHKYSKDTQSSSNLWQELLLIVLTVLPHISTTTTTTSLATATCNGGTQSIAATNTTYLASQVSIAVSGYSSV